MFIFPTEKSPQHQRTKLNNSFVNDKFNLTKLNYFQPTYFNLACTSQNHHRYNPRREKTAVSSCILTQPQITIPISNYHHWLNHNSTWLQDER